MRVTEIRPLRTRAQRSGCCGLMLIGRILFGTAHQALTRTCVSHFSKSPRRMSSTRQTKHGPMSFGAALATLASYTSVPATGHAAIWGAGRAGFLTRRERRFPIEPCCCSPALSKHSETHQLWLRTALQAGIAQEPHLVWPEDHAWCVACDVE